MLISGRIANILGVVTLLAESNNKRKQSPGDVSPRNRKQNYISKMKKHIMKENDVLEFANEHKVENVVLKTADLPGQFHHVTSTGFEFCTDLFENRIGFAGSSI